MTYTFTEATFQSEFVLPKAALPEPTTGEEREMSFPRCPITG